MNDETDCFTALEGDSGSENESSEHEASKPPAVVAANSSTMTPSQRRRLLAGSLNKASEHSSSKMTPSQRMRFLAQQKRNPSSLVSQIQVRKPKVFAKPKFAEAPKRTADAPKKPKATVATLPLNRKRKEILQEEEKETKVAKAITTPKVVAPLFDLTAKLLPPAMIGPKINAIDAGNSPGNTSPEEPGISQKKQKQLDRLLQEASTYISYASPTKKGTADNPPNETEGPPPKAATETKKKATTHTEPPPTKKCRKEKPPAQNPKLQPEKTTKAQPTVVAKKFTGTQPNPQPIFASLADYHGATPHPPQAAAPPQTAEPPQPADPPQTAPRKKAAKDTQAASCRKTAGISDADVLCGRGGAVNGHAGNVTFRHLVHLKKPLYQAATCQTEKLKICRNIVRAIQDSHGRFLKKVGTHWVKVDDSKAVVKTGQALREGQLQLKGGTTKTERSHPKQRSHSQYLTSTEYAQASTSLKSERVYFPKDFVPTVHHVICGGGQDKESHCGNQHFLTLISSRACEYDKAETVKEKSNLLDQLVQQVEERGGGFVRFDQSTALYYKAEDGRRKASSYMWVCLNQPLIVPLAYQQSVPATAAEPVEKPKKEEKSAATKPPTEKEEKPGDEVSNMTAKPPPAASKTAASPSNPPKSLKSDPIWEQAYAHLLGLHQVYGASTFQRLADSNLNTNLATHHLVEWLSQQRKLYNQQNIDPYKVWVLNTLDMDWSLPVRDFNWDWYYHHVEAYWQTHGTLKTLFRGSGVFAWLMQQRWAYEQNASTDNNNNTTSMTKEQRQKLEKVGLPQLKLEPIQQPPAQKPQPPTPSAKRRHPTKTKKNEPYSFWMLGYNELKQFHEEHGHINVPPEKPIRGWLEEQQRHYRYVRKAGRFTSEMTQTRVEMLVKLGIHLLGHCELLSKAAVLDPALAKQPNDWDSMYQTLLNFRAETKQTGTTTVVHDHCTILYAWVQEQKHYLRVFDKEKSNTHGGVELLLRAFNKDKHDLTKEQVEKLEKVGIVAPGENAVGGSNSKGADFGALLGELLAYRRNRGNINFPENDTGRLAEFVERERRHYQIYKNMGGFDTTYMNVRRINLLQFAGVLEDPERKDESPLTDRSGMTVKTRTSKRASKS